MKAPKPYNPKKTGGYYRRYESELIHTAAFNLKWQIALLIASIPVALMAVLALVLELPWITITNICLTAAIAILSLITAVSVKTGLNRYRDYTAKAEYVPECTEKGIMQARFMFAITLFFAVVLILVAVVELFAVLDGDALLQTFPVYLTYIPIIALSNAEISDIVFMSDGFYTGSPGGVTYFIPYVKIDSIAEEDCRTTKRGTPVKLRLISNGKQFGHDRMYRKELEEIRRRVASAHADNINLINTEITE